MENSELRKVGKFSIPQRTIRRNLTLAKLILKDIVVIRAEMMDWGNHIEYMAIGDCFDEIPEGVYPPTYEVMIEHDNDEMKIRFKKV